MYPTGFQGQRYSYLNPSPNVREGMEKTWLDVIMKVNLY